MTKKLVIGEIYVPVKMLERRGETVLLEWADGDETKRGYLPASVVIPETAEIALAVSASELPLAAPYGVPWAALLQVDPSDFSERLQKALHNANLWTFDDVMKNPNSVIGAIQVALGVSMATVALTARKFEKGE